MEPPDVTSLHTVLFCRKWHESVVFYRDVLGLPVLEEREGFVEFQVNALSRIGLLRKDRSSRPADRPGQALLSLRVPDVQDAHKQLANRLPDLPAVREHPWGAWVFELTDPEGRRLEFWSPREPLTQDTSQEANRCGKPRDDVPESRQRPPAVNLETPFEGGLPASNLIRELSREQVLEILDAGHRKQCRVREVLFHQGDPATRSFYMVSGRLKLTKLNEFGDQVIVRYVGPGELTAAVAVLSQKEYPVTAEVVSEAEVVSWERRTLIALMHKLPVLSMTVLEMVLKHLDDLQNRFFELSTEQVEQRLAHALLRIMRHAGHKTKDGIRIDLPLTRQELAEYTGTTLFTVSRTLKGWERRGWILSGRGRITISDPHALVHFSEQGHARNP